MTPLVWAAFIVALYGCAFAVLHGGRPERWAALGLLTTGALVIVTKGNLPIVDPLRTLLFDGMLLAFLTWLATRYRRAWLQPFSAVVVLAIAGGVAKATDTGLSYLAYATAANILAILQIVVLIVGVVFEAEQDAPSARAAGHTAHGGTWARRLASTPAFWVYVLAAPPLTGVLLWWAGVHYRLCLGGAMGAALLVLGLHAGSARLRDRPQLLGADR